MNGGKSGYGIPADIVFYKGFHRGYGYIFPYVLTHFAAGTFGKDRSDLFVSVNMQFRRGDFRGGIGLLRFVFT